MIGSKVLNADHHQIPDQPPHVLPLNPQKLLPLEQVLQQSLKNLKRVTNPPKLKQSLNEGKQGTDTNILHHGPPNTELKTDGKHPGNHSDPKRTNEPVIDQTEGSLKDTEGDVLGISVLGADGYEYVHYVAQDGLELVGGVRVRLNFEGF